MQTPPNPAYTVPQYEHSVPTGPVHWAWSTTFVFLLQSLAQAISPTWDPLFTY